MLQLLRAHVRRGRAGKGYCVINPDTIQHINLKIFVDNPTALNMADVVPVFHQWIRDSVCPEMLIDVADYLHVFEGPGILLIGLEANYSLDDRENHPGLLYNRKAELEGTFESRLAQAHGAALAACDRLEKDPAFTGKLKFNRNAIEIFVNDRLLAPNNDETWQALEPGVSKSFPGFTIRRVGEPRDLFRVSATKG
jgi:hypothetical protein